MSDGQSEKDKGNAAFRKGDYATALKHYDKAIKNAGGDVDAALYSNKAAALLKLKKYDQCLQQCLKGLSSPGLTPELKSNAYESQEKFEEAMEALKKCASHPQVAEKMYDVMFKMTKGDPDAVKALTSVCNSFLQPAASCGVDMTGLISLMERLATESPDESQSFVPPFGYKRKLKFDMTSVSEPNLDDGRKQSRAELEFEHSLYVENYRKEQEELRHLPMGKCQISNNRIHCPDSGHVCTALLGDLKPITIGQMRLHEVNVGMVLVCRTIAEPFAINAVATLIEDPKGEATRFSIYNLCSPDEDLSAVLPIGTYLAVKEPWYKTGACDGKRTLRVDNPADIVYLERTHDLLLNLAWRTDGPAPSSTIATSSGTASAGIIDPDSWDSYQKRGNEYFRAGKLELAIAAYTDAINLKREVAPKELADLFSNRAAAYLGDGRSTDAFRDCQSALQLKPDHLKATFRMAKAQAQLCNYEKAKDILVKSPHKIATDVKTEISRLNRLIREKQTGFYDLKSLLKEAAGIETPRLDHADYNGGVCQKWISKEKGNGLTALAEFAPGDLLFVEKAFEATYRSECSLGFCFKAGEMAMNDPSHNECVSRIIRRVSKNTELAKELYKLYAGPNFERFNDADTVAVDSKRFAAIVDQNAFGSNDFEAEFNAAGRPKIESPGAGFSFGGCGIWILASYMNHSCVPNAIILYVGDLMIVRAAKRIRKGEELTTSYIALSFDYEKRQEKLKKYGFKCECELCVCDLQRAVDQPYVDVQREVFMDSFDADMRPRLHEAVRGHTQSIANVVEDARILVEDFSSRLAYKNRYDTSLERLYAALGHGYHGQLQWLKAAQAYEKAYFAAVGREGTSADEDTFISHAFPLAFFHCFNITYNALLGLDLRKAKKYLGRMRQAAKICWGSDDKELLEMLFPGLPIKDLFECLI